MKIMFDTNTRRNEGLPKLRPNSLVKKKERRAKMLGKTGPVIEDHHAGEMPCETRTSSQK